MTDRELLEAAAKAAGMSVRCVGNGEPGGAYSFYIEPDSLWWNPLTDDGDAFRLAVKLRIEVWNNLIEACCSHSALGCNIREPHGADPYAATRRAIVRAAAALQSSKG